MFLWHFPWGRPPWPLASTLPCGARTFLPPCCHGRRPSDLLWRVLQYSAAARCKRRARRPSDYEATVLQARATTSSAHSERVSQSPRSAYANPPRANTAKTVAVQRGKLSARAAGARTSDSRPSAVSVTAVAGSSTTGAREVEEERGGARAVNY